MASGFRDPNSSNGPVDLSWVTQALGRDISRGIRALGSGLMAPGNALAGNYNQIEIGPNGSVSQVDPRMIADANSLSGVIALGAPGGVPAGALGMGIKSPHVAEPAFGKWFGNSKVVDAEGAPLIVYHNGTFNEATGTPNRPMHFGTADAAEARLASGAQEARGAKQTQTTAAYLSLKNPKRVEDAGNKWGPVIRKAKAEGYDGIVYPNKWEDVGSDSYIAFDPAQIKSVNNHGTFDPNDPKILNATGGVPALSAVGTDEGPPIATPGRVNA